MVERSYSNVCWAKLTHMSVLCIFYVRKLNKERVQLAPLTISMTPLRIVTACVSQPNATFQFIILSHPQWSMVEELDERTGTSRWLRHDYGTQLQAAAAFVFCLNWKGYFIDGKILRIINFFILLFGIKSIIRKKNLSLIIKLIKRLIWFFTKLFFL